MGMKTIFSAQKKPLTKPEFIGVSLTNKRPVYWSFESRQSRNDYGKNRGNVYAINVFPKNWPLRDRADI